MMTKLHCPTCGVEIDEHEAGRCLDVWAAEVVMGYSLMRWIDYPTREPRILKMSKMSGTWRVPDYSTDISASWTLIEKFREDPLSHTTATSFVDAIADATDANQDDFMADVYNLMMGLTPLTITRAAIKAVSQ